MSSSQHDERAMTAPATAPSDARTIPSAPAGSILARTEPLRDAPSPLAIFESAEARGERRFYAAHPRRGLEIVAVGRVAEIRADTPSDRATLRARVEALVSRIVPVAPSGGPAHPEGARADDPPRAERDAEGPAPGPLLVGGIAFDAAPAAGRAAHWAQFGAASFVLPELLVVRTPRGTWLTRTAAIDRAEIRGAPPARNGHDAAVLDALARIDRAAAWLEKAPAARTRPRGELHCAAADPDDPRRTRYLAAVDRVIAAIRRGEAYKVVLASEEVFEGASIARTVGVLADFAGHQPESLTYAQGIGDTTFLGASFERLAYVRGVDVRTAAIAGTIAKSDLTDREAGHPLSRSTKDRDEQAIVAEQIQRALDPIAEAVAMDAVPQILSAGAFHHLHTRIRARLARPVHLLDVVDRLHPTPALGGHPCIEALALIRAHEPFDRGWYGGPIGWVGPSGDGEMYVALRCALAEPGVIRMFAGSGVMADSVPEREARETSQKLGAIRRVVEGHL